MFNVIILYKIKKETNNRFYQYYVVIIFDNYDSQKKISQILCKSITILDVLDKFGFSW